MLLKGEKRQPTNTSSLLLLANRHMKHFSSAKFKKEAKLHSIQFFHSCSFTFKTRSKVLICNFIVTILVNRSQAVPTQGSINSGSEKGALAVSFTSNACTIKQATDNHCLFWNSVLSTEVTINMKGGKDPWVFLPLQRWKVEVG